VDRHSRCAAGVSGADAVHASVLLTGSGGCVIAVTDVAMSKAGMQTRPN
jgi:hypothetical protein